MSRLAVFICSFGYLGYFPFAPGTIGSAAGLALLWGLRTSGAPGLEPVAIVLLFIIGAWSGTHAEAHFGTTDPGQGIIDEVMGMMVTLLFIPFGWRAVLAGFVIFRILDVVKPFPAAHFERLPGGTGMMADDLIAAVYANLLLRVVMWLGFL
jgi:phosphatidylglycerophosphatase A